MNRWVTNRPWLTIALFTAVTTIFAVRVPDLTIDTDVVSLMPESHPERQMFEWAQDYFDARSAVLLVVVTSEPGGVFRPSTLELIAHLSEKLASLDAIDDDVTSLSEVDNIRGEADTLIVEPFFEEAPPTQAGARAVGRAVLANPMMVGRVVTMDGRAAIVGGEVREGFDKGLLYDRLKDMVAASPITDERVIVAGRPVLDGEWGRLARGDLRRMLPLVLVTVGLLLGWLLRSVRGAVLPVVVVLAAVTWTLGLMAWLGATFYALATLMPIMLIAIGVADGVHVIHHFGLHVRADPQRPAAECVRDTMDRMSLPVIMTSITTAAGFGSLVLSPLTAVQSFGLFTAFGVLAAMVFSLTILPALLCVLPMPGKWRASTSARSSGLAHTLAPLVVRRPLVIWSGAAIVMTVGLSGLPRIVVDGSLIRNFPEGNPARRADAELIRYFGGSYPMQIVFTVDEPDGWKDPVKLSAISGLQRHLEKLGHTGRTRSIADYVERMHHVLNVGDLDASEYPTSSMQVAQYLLLYSMSGEPGDFDDVIDSPYQNACAHALVRADHSPLLRRVLADVDSYAAQHLAPLGIETEVTGNAKLAYVFIDLITRGQALSLVVALALVVLLTTALFGSLLIGLVAVTPAVLAVVLGFGVLGWLGIPLGAATAMISSIAIGVGVDFAIHFLVAYQACCRAGLLPEVAMTQALATAGAAILYNAVVVFAGFMVLATSSFPPNRALGLVVALNMAVCLVGTMTVMASLLATRQRRLPHSPGQTR